MQTGQAGLSKASTHVKKFNHIRDPDDVILASRRDSLTAKSGNTLTVTRKDSLGHSRREIRDQVIEDHDS